MLLQWWRASTLVQTLVQPTSGPKSHIWEMLEAWRSFSKASVPTNSHTASNHLFWQKMAQNHTLISQTQCFTFHELETCLAFGSLKHRRSKSPLASKQESVLLRCKTQFWMKLSQLVEARCDFSFQEKDTLHQKPTSNLVFASQGMVLDVSVSVCGTKMSKRILRQVLNQCSFPTWKASLCLTEKLR